MATVQQQIAAAAAKYGFNRVGIAGLIGNATQESSLNPNLNMSTGRGLFSWSAADGNPQASQVQLGNIEQQIGLVVKAIGRAGVRAMNNAGSPGNAAVWFEQNFEKAGTPMMQNRINAANAAFSGGVGKGLASSPIGSIGTGSTTIGTLPGLSIQQPTFNQSGFNQANQAYKLGTIMKMLGSVSSGLDTGPKLDIGPSAMTGLYEKGLISNTAPNPQDFQGMKTVSIAHRATLALQGMAGTGLVNTHPGAAGYVNPIPGAVIGRTDMGVDINLKPGAPVRAIGDSKVLGIIPDWYAGQPYYAFKLLNGPQAGHVYYVAEQFSPHVRPGQTVRRGQTIGTYASHGTGIEIGWASPTNWQQTLAQAQGNTGDASHNNAPAGVNFRSFLGGLGV